MEYKLNEGQIELIERASEITDTGYDAEINDEKINVDLLLDLIEDLEKVIEKKQKEKDDLERNLKDNYRPIPVSEQYSVYDSDFR